MLIGLIAPPWLPVPPPSYGGTEFAVDTLARGLAGCGHEVLLAAAAESTCPVPRVPGLPPAAQQTIGRGLDELCHIAMAYPALAGADIIHDHTMAGPGYRYRPPGVPVVATVHGDLPEPVARFYEVVQAGTSLVAISRHQASTAPRVSFRAVIHHGLDPDTVPVGPGDGGYVCFVGRLGPAKGLPVAIAAARLAGVPLRIAAKMREPLEYEYFGDVVKPLLGPNEDFLGELGTQEKYELMGGAMALLNPMQWDEPFGLVMIESLATGTPVVCTPRGAAPEIVDEAVTGFLRSDEAALAEALPRAPALDRSACRRAVVERFSEARMVADHIRLYQELLGTGN